MASHEVVIWGSGTPRREFLHVDDMAAASLFVLNLPKQTYDENTDPMLSHINVGTGVDISILELAQLVAKGHWISGGRSVLIPRKPDGTMRKLMDVGRLSSNGMERPYTNSNRAWRIPTSGIWPMLETDSDVRKQIQ